MCVDSVLLAAAKSFVLREHASMGRWIDGVLQLFPHRVQLKHKLGEVGGVDFILRRLPVRLKPARPGAIST
jgi:hypothetical protein